MRENEFAIGLLFETEGDLDQTKCTITEGKLWKFNSLRWICEITVYTIKAELNWWDREMGDGGTSCLLHFYSVHSVGGSEQQRYIIWICIFWIVALYSCLLDSILQADFNIIQRWWEIGCMINIGKMKWGE